jgi:glycosyltransferase Alg8
MIKRFDRKTALYSLIGPFSFYLSLGSLIGYIFWPYFYYVKSEKFIVLGIFAFWRYGWLAIRYIRAFIYHFMVYPKLREKVKDVLNKGHLPAHIYFIIPSYNEKPWVSSEAFLSILSEISSLPCKATLLVATGSELDDQVIQSVCEAHPAKEKIELVFQRQSSGKRIAMGHAIRALSRHYYSRDSEHPGSVTIFMDGDTALEPGILRKVIPLFTVLPNLGAATTNELAYIHTSSKWYRDWFNLKFGQRHVLFQSQSLSRKVLTLTGRFSAFRTSIIVKEDFIQQLERDTLTHPLFGKFRFLMGDDKSTWFYLLKHGWDMLYVPDALCYSLESRNVSFLKVSLDLYFRWYGNTLRTNGRALALGVKRVGLFTWWCILDQRLSAWTPLVGITSAFVLSIFKDPVFLPMYFAWVFIVRTVQITVIALGGHPVSLRSIPLTLYSQWIGALIKIRVLFHLADQAWSKGKTAQKGQHIPVPHPWASFMPDYLMALSFVALIFFLLLTHHSVYLPDVHAFIPSVKAKEQHTVIDAADAGVTPNDGKDDSKVLNDLLAQVERHTVIRLPSGVLDIFHPIKIAESGIIMEGQGKRQTKLHSHLKLGAALDISGEIIPTSIPLLRDTVASQTFIELPEHSVAKGDFILLRMPNDEEFFETIDSRCWRRKFPLLRQGIFEIQRVEKKLVYLDRPLDFPFKSAVTEVHKIRMVTGVCLKNFTLEQIIPGHKIQEVQYQYKNLFPEYQANLVEFRWAAHCIIENASLYAAAKHPLVFENAFSCQAKGLDIDGAWNKGKKANGYVRFSRSYRCLFSKVKVRNIRHITIQWSSAYNSIDNTVSSVDVNFHGGYPHHNLVSHVTFKLDPRHPWDPVTFAPNDACWAPPNGPNNSVQFVQTHH